MKRFLLIAIFVLPSFVFGQDTITPVISNFFTQNTVYLQVLTSFNDLVPDYKVMDAIDGDVTQLAYFDKKVDSTEGLPQLITFIAPDKSGNKAIKKLVVQTIDTIAPVISLKGDSVVYLAQNQGYIDQGYAVKENYIYSIVTTGTFTGETDSIGQYNITQMVMDVYRNMDCATRTICVGLDSTVCKSVGVKGCGKKELTKVSIRKMVINTPSLFPNPSSGQFFVENMAEVRLLEIYNSQGNRVLSKQNNQQNSLLINLENPGVYFC